MGKPLSLLVVDMSVGWEEVLKARERGYTIELEHSACGEYVRRVTDPNLQSIIQYPHGSVRAGFNAIIDTTRIAHERSIPTYAVEFYPGDSDGEEQTCHSLQPYIRKANRYKKDKLSAFTCDLAERLRSEGCRHLIVIGYDRDDCVLSTIRDAVKRKITVVTSEKCMLTAHGNFLRKESLTYFRKHTAYLETLEDVWNYLRDATK